MVKISCSATRGVVARWWAAVSSERIAWNAMAKRAFDIVASATVLLVLAIPLALVALAIKLDSPGPVLYRSRRVGYRGRPLMMLKFRKMRDGSTGSPLTASADMRLTRIGRVLVRTHVDELPQFWDVLCGRMSVVGPRPEDPTFAQMRWADFESILRVRPGLTGLSQIAFAEEHKILDPEAIERDYVERILPQKIGLDRLYTERDSIRMDASVLIWTLAAVVLRKPVAVHRGTGSLNLRRRRPGTPPGYRVQSIANSATAVLAAPAPEPHTAITAASVAGRSVSVCNQR